MGNEISTGSLARVSHSKKSKKHKGGTTGGNGGGAVTPANGSAHSSSDRGSKHRHENDAPASAPASKAAEREEGGTTTTAAAESRRTNGGGGGGKSGKKGVLISEPSAASFGDKRDANRKIPSRQHDCPVIEDALADVRVKYHIAPREVGHGHYGVVRKCMDRKTREWYAIKSIRKSKVGKIEVLRREVGLLREVSHPNIIKLVDVYEDVKYLHLITELCTGGELFDRIIAKTQSDEGHFSERDAAKIVRCILDAIAYCHDKKQIVHRDLKPENFLFKTEADDADIKIIDFGLSRHDTQNYGVMKTKVGTPYYVAPEVLNREYTKSCDIWSIGVITYILLCGYPPFYGDNDNQIFDSVRTGRFDFPRPDWDNISSAAKDFICALLRKDPRMRLSAAEALRHRWIREFAPVVVEAAPQKKKEEQKARQEEKEAGGDKEVANDGVEVSNGGDDAAARIRHEGDHCITFRRYRGMQKLKKAALGHIAAHLTQSEVGSLGTVFRDLDDDGDGIITLRELDVAISGTNVNNGKTATVSIDPAVVSDLRQLRDDLCLTGEDTLNWRDFLASTMDRKTALREDKIKEAFDHFKSTEGECLLVPDLVDMFGGEGHAKEIIGDLDEDHDGRITYEEFRRMLTESFSEHEEAVMVGA